MTDRTHRRAPARPTAGRSSPPSARSGAGRGAGRPSAFIRGDDGMRRTDEEIERNKQRAEQRRNSSNKPFRFFVPVGETRQIIICDDKPDFFLYEHALKDQDGKWGRLFTGCIKEFDNCPVCKSTGKESTYIMVLTVIDLTPFSTRDGDEVEFSRKLLVVKPAQQKKFHRFYMKEGTLRGALFDMTRDGDKDSSIGSDIDFVEFVPEEEMETYVRSYKDRDGKRHTDVCHEPFDYESIFEEPTMESLLAITGGEPQPGSRAANERELGGRGRGRDAPRRGRGDADDWEDGDDRREFGERGRGRGGRRDGDGDDYGDAPNPPSRRSGRGTPRDDDQGSEDAPRRPARRGADDEAEDARERAPRRSRAAPEDEAPPPREARRGRAGGREPEDESGADEPPSRTTRTRRPAAEPESAAPERPSRSRATRTTGRSRPPADELPEDDDIPF